MTPHLRSGASPEKYSVVVVPSEHCEVFREAAEAVHYGLLALGHQSDICGVGWPSDTIPIVFGWNMLPPGVLLPPESILYNLEQPGSHWLEPERALPND